MGGSFSILKQGEVIQRRSLPRDDFYQNSQSRFLGAFYKSTYHEYRRGGRMITACHIYVSAYQQYTGGLDAFLGVSKQEDLIVKTQKDEITIPSDIIIEILRRLPLRYVLKVRAVCKLWNSLTREDHFIYKHLRNTITPTDLGVIFMRSQHYLNEVSPCYHINGFHSIDVADIFDDLDILKGIRMSSSCDGMVCVYGSQTTCVINPSMREVVVLPKAKYKSATTRVALAKTIEGEYKVVRFFSHKDLTIGCEIFYLNSHSWITVQDAPLIDFVFAPVVANGAIHWMPSPHLSSDTIVSFDVKKEIFDVIRRPTGMFRSRYTCLKELGGRLCLLVLPEDYPPLRFKELWILEDYDNQVWRKHHISLQQFEDEEGVMMEPVTDRDGKLLWMGYLGNFRYHDLKTGKFTEPLFDLQWDYSYIMAHSYNESLVSPIALQEKRQPRDAEGRCMLYL